MDIFDLLFPKRCVSCGRLGAYICRDCFAKIEYVDKPVCPICQRQAVGGRTHPGCANRLRLDGLVVVCRYYGPVKRAIAKVKYKWVYDIEKVFVDLVAENLWRYDLPSDLVIVPVPLHAKRQKWRGFNQAEILANSLAATFGVAVSGSLIRISEVRPQVGLKRDERRANVSGAFDLRPFDKLGARAKMINVKGKDIVLVDDVYTSGATMAECCRVLKRAGAGQVWGLAVALG